MACQFCQNFPFSQQNTGRDTSLDQLAKIMGKLAKKKVHNLNFVTPTHYIPQLLSAYLIAWEEVCHLPIVYNTSGFERVEVLKLLDGIVDIYLPDMKYASADYAGRLSRCPSYVQYQRTAIIEMFRQVGPLAIDSMGVAKRGLLVRHLVLPRNRQGTAESFAWLAKNIGNHVDVSLMSQYFPSYNAPRFPEINRHITSEEYLLTIEIVEALGFHNVWAQDLTAIGNA